MSPKKKWIIFAAVAVLVAGGAGTLIYYQQQSLAENREEAERLRGEIAAGRELVGQTPDLEREVIVQRETDEVIKEILSEEEEITNFARTINDYAAQAEVAIRSVKRQQARGRHGQSAEAKDFDRVGYTIQFDADAFQLLSFLNLFETHKRFISVTSFKLTAANRSAVDRGELPLHSVTLDLETYVYHPKQGAEEMRIDGYERKRDLLLADIRKRSDELRVPVYEYRGPRGRRDPWIDPRLEVNEGLPQLSIEEQIRIVENLALGLDEVEELWDAVEDAEHVIEEMKARAALEQALVELEDEVRKVQSREVIQFGPSLMRLENVIVAGVDEIQSKLEDTRDDLPGASMEEIEQVAKTVKDHLAREDYELAVQSFEAVEPRLIPAESDPNRAPAVAALRGLADQARAVLEFEKIDMTIGGVAVMEGVRPVALINGDTIAAGEYLGLSGELFVQDIKSHEIEFVYQGVTLVRRIDERTPSANSSGKQKRN